MHNEFPDLPVVAEDLGLITPEVDKLRKKHNLPGMKVLQFAFDGNEKNPHLPANYNNDCVAYTGTHDNNTSVAWYNELNDKTQKYVRDTINFSEDIMPWPLIKTALDSEAVLAIVPLQDIMALGADDRMNIPGIAKGNWCWRFKWKSIKQELPKLLK